MLHDRPVGPIDDVERHEGEREDDEEGRVDRGDPLALDVRERGPAGLGLNLNHVNILLKECFSPARNVILG